MRIRITNTDANVLTIEVNGESFALDKDTVAIFTDPDTRKDNLTLTGFGNDGLKKFDFLLADVALPTAQASKAALIATVGGYISGTAEQQVFTPLTATSSTIVASKNRNLYVHVRPAGTIAAHTLVLPLMFDGQILTLTSNQTITTWTLTQNGATTMENAPTAGAVNFSRSWIYNAALDKLIYKA